VLTEKLAKKLFGNEEAMGKVVRIDSSDNFTVTGILKDLPNNTSVQFEYLMNWAYMTKLGWDDSSWGNNSIRTYVLAEARRIAKGFRRKDQEHHDRPYQPKGKRHHRSVYTPPHRCVPVFEIGERKLCGRPHPDGKLFSIIAVFILLIACINFMNLSTARSEKRAKEVGIRKVVGAPKRTLVGQFLGESILLALLAGIVAIVIVLLSLPAFNLLVNKELYVEFFNPYSGFRACCS
jgi:putative ABC transport system permease protein